MSGTDGLDVIGHDRLEDSRVEFLQPSVREVEDREIGQPKYTSHLPHLRVSDVAHLLHGVSELEPLLRRAALGQGEQVDGVPGADLSGDCPSRPERLIVRMREDVKDPHRASFRSTIVG